MRRLSFLFFTLLLLVFLVACGGGESNESADESGEGESSGSGEGDIDISVAGSVLGGVFYAQSAALAEKVNNEFDSIRMTVETTSGGHENAIMVENQDNAMGISTTLAAYEFMNGEGEFPAAAENLTAIGYSDPTLFHLVVPADSDIHSIQDLKGKVVNPGAQGSGTESTLPGLLEPLGLSYDDFDRVEYLAFDEAADAMKDNTVDAIFWLGGYPASSIQELDTSIGIRVITFSDEEIEKITDSAPYFTEGTIPQDAYEGADEDINTIEVRSLFLVNKNLPEDVVYDITKYIIENQDELAKAHNGFDNWSFNREMEDILPLHPGAEKYYDENDL